MTKEKKIKMVRRTQKSSDDTNRHFVDQILEALPFHPLAEEAYLLEVQDFSFPSEQDFVRKNYLK